VVPQDFSISCGDALDLTVTLIDDTDFPSLDGTMDVVWQAFTQGFGVPTSAIPILSKSTAIGGVTLSGSPSHAVVVSFAGSDTADLPTGNYYHEVRIIDGGGNKTLVAYGMMTVTLALSGE